MTNTFPALAIQPPQQQQDILGQYAKLLSIRNAIQEQQFQRQMQPLQLQQQQQAVQLQRQQILDQQAGQKAYAQWDGKDYNDLAELTIRNGGSLAQAQQIATFGLTKLKDLSTIHANEGKAGLDRIEALQKNNDTAAGRFDALNNVSDDQLPQAFQATLQQGLKDGWVDQQHAQIGQQVAQLPGAQIRNLLPFVVKGYSSESAQKESFLKDAQAFEAQQRGLETQSMMQAGGTPAMQDVRYTNLAAKQAQGQPLSADEQAFMKGYEQRKTVGAQFRVENRQGPQGTWQLVEDTKGNPTLLNSVTGETKPAPGIQKVGTYQKTTAGPQAAVNYATNYQSSGQFTGPGEEALIEQFFEMAKPSSGFRMSEAQIGMLKNAQSWLNSAKATGGHGAAGTYFSSDQRKQIVSTMNALAASKGISAMSSSATVPVIGPDGNTYDMPHDQVADAIAKGGKLAMDIIGPDNKTYPIPLDQVHAALAQGGTLKPPAMPAAPIPQALQPTPTLQQAASIQDPAQRYAAIRQRMQEDAAPIAQSASAAVPAMPVSQAVSALPKAGTLLPSAEEAAKVFNQLADDIGDHPVEITDQLSKAASRAQDWAASGGQRIKQITDFVKRVTDPDLPELTWQEARDFYSNTTGRLSPEQAQKLSPQGRRVLGNFADALDDALARTANNADRLDEYRQAMSEYKTAMGLSDVKEAVKDQAIRILKYAIPGAATAYAIKSAVSR